MSDFRLFPFDNLIGNIKIILTDANRLTPMLHKLEAVSIGLSVARVISNISTCTSRHTHPLMIIIE